MRCLSEMQDSGRGGRGRGIHPPPHALHNLNGGLSMRHLSALTAVALLALPLVADDAKKAQTKPKAEAQTAPAAKDDASPMLAAAKRANRLGKTPKFIITSE